MLSARAMIAPPCKTPNVVQRASDQAIRPRTSCGELDMSSIPSSDAKGIASSPPASGIEASLPRRARDARHGLHVRGHPHVELLLQLGLQDLAKRARDDRLQLLIHLVLRPEEGLQVLHPLEVRDRHPAGVGEDVWDEEDVALAKDRVSLWRGRAVRAFDDHRCLDVA